jgi:hypothetical protein
MNSFPTFSPGKYQYCTAGVVPSRVSLNMTTVSPVTSGRSACTNNQWPIMFFSSRSHTWTTFRDAVSASLNTYVPGCRVTPGISTAPLKVKNVRSLVLVSCAATPFASTARTASASAVAIIFTRFMRSSSHSFVMAGRESGLAQLKPPQTPRPRRSKLHLVCLLTRAVSECPPTSSL